MIGVVIVSSSTSPFSSSTSYSSPSDPYDDSAWTYKLTASSFSYGCLQTLHEKEEEEEEEEDEDGAIDGNIGGAREEYECDEWMMLDMVRWRRPRSKKRFKKQWRWRRQHCWERRKKREKREGNIQTFLLFFSLQNYINSRFKKYEPARFRLVGKPSRNQFWLLPTLADKSPNPTGTLTLFLGLCPTLVSV